MKQRIDARRKAPDKHRANSGSAYHLAQRARPCVCARIRTKCSRHCSCARNGLVAACGLRRMAAVVQALFGCVHSRRRLTDKCQFKVSIQDARVLLRARNSNFRTASNARLVCQGSSRNERVSRLVYRVETGRLPCHHRRVTDRLGSFLSEGAHAQQTFDVARGMASFFEGTDGGDWRLERTSA
jgi:hypothetical protein